jgi:hypothetical protein
LALKSFIEFYPCCSACCCFIVHFSNECIFRLFHYFTFVNIAKKRSSTSNLLIKHLIKYRYKVEHFYIYFHNFQSSSS